MSDYPKTTVRVAAFVRRHWKGCRRWPRQLLLAWVQWFIDNDRFQGITEGGKVVGVAMYRFVDVEEDVTQHDYRDTGGKLAFVALCTGKTAGIMRHLYHMAMDAGMKACEKICWARDKHCGRGSIYNINTLHRRFNYGQR